MNRPILFLRHYAASDGRLHSQAQAENMVLAIEAYESRWVTLDFSGIKELNWEFASEFIRLAGMLLPEGIWLVPRNYNYCANKLIGSLISPLKLLREQAWRDSYEWLWGETRGAHDGGDCTSELNPPSLFPVIGRH